MVRTLLCLLVTLTAVGHAAELKVGDKAPEFSLPAADGKTYKLSQFIKDKKIVVLEWFNKDCPYVHKFYDSQTMQKLQAEQKKKNIVWLTIASSAEGKEGHLTSADAPKVYKEKGMASTALLIDGKSEVAKLYSAKTTPHMFIIDAKGLIAYEGAIDDRPSATAKSLDGAQNYVRLALASMAVPEPIKTSSTTPYGCSVKY